MDKLKNFQAVLKKNKLDGFIVTNPINIFYLTEFKGISQTEREAILVFTPKPTLITARLYQNEARLVESRLAKQIAARSLIVKIVTERNDLFSFAKNLLEGKNKIGFEENNLRVSEFNFFKKGANSLKLASFANLIEGQRAIKTAGEIKKIEKAQIISQKAFEEIVKTVKPQQSEMEIAEKLEKIIKSLGGHDLAFESIVAAGPNSAIPHYTTGKRKTKKGEVLLLDFGAKFQNYHADLSRTIFVGKAKDEHKKIYSHVKSAQQTAISQIKKGTKTKDAFNFANNHFKNHKLEKYFIHGLGHGIGLEIHETPFLRTSTEDLLLENMVFSVEPGLYFPWGGVRIEDLVVIQNGRAKVLGKTQEQLIEI